MEPASAITLTPLEQRLMHQIERRGLHGFVLTVTLVSIVLSELITVPMMLLIKSSAAELAIGVGTAFAVPCIVAPLSALLVGRLLDSLSRASVELHHLARTDPLTGVSNRRSFAEESTALWERRAERLVFVAMVDINDFKAVNDRYGHAAGDLALTTLAAGLTGAVFVHSAAAVVGRLGGDEFAVVALVPDQRAAALLGSSLVDACDLDPACPGVTATVGWVAAEPDASIDEALARADHALYAAKRPTDRTPPAQAPRVVPSPPVMPSAG